VSPASGALKRKSPTPKEVLEKTNPDFGKELGTRDE
jgi:hypothetical protein